MSDAEALRFTLTTCVWLLAAMAVIWVVGMMAMLPPRDRKKKP